MILRSRGIVLSVLQKKATVFARAKFRFSHVAAHIMSYLFANTFYRIKSGVSFQEYKLFSAFCYITQS